MLERGGGFEIVGEAADGQEAVALTAELQPDVIILDVAMPHMDGIQALPLLHDASPGVKVVVLSGHDSPDVVAQAKLNNAAAFLSKGTAADEIVATLREVCSS
jgi:two-component system, chemotaxis family, chemotaxis protein CheY